MDNDIPRSRAARAAAERALIQVVRNFGARPEFVVLGGLVPELLCTNSAFRHAGTTDVDVQVDLEIACGTVNLMRLELALRDAGFEPSREHIWRWTVIGLDSKTVVKFELLADLDYAPAGAPVHFNGCTNLGAVNLRGTGFASRDVEVRTLRTRVGGVELVEEINVTGLAGYLLAKSAAAHSRREPKDWYDLAFVLIHNDVGGPEEAAQAVLDRFGNERMTVRTALDDLLDNFATPDAQGPQAYANQLMLDHPELDRTSLLADAVLAIDTFHRRFYTI